MMKHQVLVCGSNDSGQLGIGTVQDSNELVPVGGASNIAHLAFGDAHAAACTQDGDVYAWGSCDSGVLGDGAENGECAALPKRVQALEGFMAERVACGAAHTVVCARNDVLAWGNNEHGECAQPEDILTVRRPKIVRALKGVRISAVTCGEWHTLALAATGQLWAWGANESGQLGLGHFEEMRDAVPVEAMWGLAITAVAAGEAHSCALTSGGSVFTWGRNNAGQLGLREDAAAAAVTAKARGGGGVKRRWMATGPINQRMLSQLLDMGIDRSKAERALLETGCVGVEVAAEWLFTHEAQIDQDMQEDAEERANDEEGITCPRDPASSALVPTRRRRPADRVVGDLRDRAVSSPHRVLLPPMRFVAAGGNHTAAASARVIFTWGLGRSGQLGHEEVHDERLPRQIDAPLTGATFLAVACGREHTVALLKRRGGVDPRGDESRHAEDAAPVEMWGCGSTSSGQLLGAHAQDGKMSTFSRLAEFRVGGGRPGQQALIATLWRPLENAITLLEQNPAPQEPSSDPRVANVRASAVREVSSLVDVIFSSPTAISTLFGRTSTEAGASGTPVAAILAATPQGGVPAKQPGVGLDCEALERTYIRLLAPREPAIAAALAGAQGRLLDDLLQRLPLMHSPERVQVLLSLLISPLLAAPDLATPLVPRLSRAVSGLPGAGRSLLARWIAQLPPSTTVARLIRPVQAHITHGLQQLHHLTPAAVEAIQLLALVFDAVKGGGHIRLEEFYNSYVSRKLDVHDHYVAWRERGAAYARTGGAGPAGAPSPESFSFCDFPFLLDARAKAQILRWEARIQMHQTVSQARQEHVARALFGLPVGADPSNECVLATRKRRPGARGGPQASAPPPRARHGPAGALHTIGLPVGLFAGFGGLIFGLPQERGHGARDAAQALQHATQPEGSAAPEMSRPEVDAALTSAPDAPQTPAASGDSRSVQPPTDELPAPHESGVPAEHPDLCLVRVRRSRLAEDALEEIARQRPRDLRKPLRVHFIGEEGLDDGGLKKEFFQLLVQRLLSPDYGLFVYQADSRSYWLAPLPPSADDSSDTEDMLAEHMLVGLAVGLAVYNGVLLDLPFPRAMYKKLLSQEIDLSDLELMQPTVGRSLRMLLDWEPPESCPDATLADTFCLTFTVDVARYGKVVTEPLVPGGDEMPVTEANRRAYVDAYVAHALNKSVAEQFAAFSRGFLTVCGGPALQLFRPEELEVLTCGTPHLDFAALEGNATYEGWTKDHQAVRWFWEIVHGMTLDERRRLLRFFSGSDRAPIGGLGNLRLVIQRDGPDTMRLPTSRTCFNVLLLPEYSSRGKMRDRLLNAIHNAEGFGLQ
ncbi:unnamed protein product [Pedinophyceae sp. YPF-701]|nr:unnamed protein product [Pedinophyceae sp. YPF-701]